MAQQDHQGTVLIAGGGIAGLTAAKTLHDAGFEAIVLERDAHIGGRMSTRQFGGGVFDDGAQFFTVKDRRFAPMADEWIAAGVVHDWFHSHLIRGGASNPDGYPRYCGSRGMRSILDHIAGHGLDVRTGADVSGLQVLPDGYELALSSGDTLSADAVILAHPAPDAVHLLEDAGVALNDDDIGPLREVGYKPAIVVMAVMDCASALTEWGGLRIEGEFIDWIADNHRKGISPDKPAITIQAMPRFSVEHWDWDDNRLAEVLLDNAKALLRCDAVEVRVHRWPLGKPASTHLKEWIAAKHHPRVLLAGDGFRGYRVEGAAVSGLEAARELIRRFS